METIDFPAGSGNDASMAAAKHDNLKLAIAAILVGCLALSLGDALIKQESARFPLWQIFVVRSALVIPFLIYFARLRSCRMPLLPLRFGWTLLRSLILVLMWIVYFTALPNIELAIAAAGYYTTPLFIVLLAALFLHESISLRGWLALALGFAGTLLILRPSTGDFEAWALLPVFSAICYAGAMVLTRSKCRDENPVILALWLNIAFVAVGLFALLALEWLRPAAEIAGKNAFLLGEWVSMDLGAWRIMAILAGAILAGSVGAAIAYQYGPASTVAVFDFSYLGFAVIWGLLLFGEIPQATEALGIVMIASAGVFAVRQRARQKPA